MKTLSWLMALVLAPAAGNQITFDNAVYGRTPGGWLASAAWKVVKDPTAPSQPYALAHVPAGPNGGAFATAVLDAPGCRDGEVSVKFMPGGRKAGLVWRYRDARNYYFVRADAEEQTVAVYRVEDGRASPVPPRRRKPGEWAVKHYVHPDTWSLLRVAYQGTRITVYYNHRRILQAEDNAIGEGKVGLWTRASSPAHFDNFRFVRGR